MISKEALGGILSSNNHIPCPAHRQTSFLKVYVAVSWLILKWEKRFGPVPSLEDCLLVLKLYLYLAGFGDFAAKIGCAQALPQFHSHKFSGKEKRVSTINIILLILEAMMEIPFCKEEKLWNKTLNSEHFLP